MKDLHIGLTAKSTETVTKQNTAISIGSGDLPVYATPAMLALMENAATKAIDGYLSESATTVGTKIDIRHIAATPMTHQITARAELIEIDKRKLIFRVESFDENEKIGEGFHERFIVDRSAFMDKTESKRR